MTLRKALLVLLSVFAIAAVGMIGVDFLQLRRKAPALVSPEDRADLIRVDKTARTLILLHGRDVIKSYDVSLGPVPAAQKTQEGDGRTPEGRYTIDTRNARSHFHLALHISYPDADDRANAQRRGVPPGGDIMVHGLPNGLGWLGKLHLERNWTDGCIAVTNGEMDEIWAHVPTGTPIEILP